MAAQAPRLGLNNGPSFLQGTHAPAPLPRRLSSCALFCNRKWGKKRICFEAGLYATYPGSRWECVHRKIMPRSGGGRGYGREKGSICEAARAWRELAAQLRANA